MTTQHAREETPDTEKSDEAIVALVTSGKSKNIPKRWA